MKVSHVRSIAARSPNVAWLLMTSDEQRHLLTYVERAQGWVRDAAPDATCYTAAKQQKGGQTGKVRLAG